MYDDSPDSFETTCDRIAEVVADESLLFSYYLAGPPEQGVDRQVIFVPTKFNCEPANFANVGGGYPDIIYVDYLTVECWIGGESYADAQRIRRQVLNAVRVVLRANGQPIDGAYPKQIGGALADRVKFSGVSLLQKFIWAFNVQRSDDGYLATVKEIDVVDSTQITTTDDGVLTPSEQLEIKE
jgi:hypothetical protein